MVHAEALSTSRNNPRSANQTSRKTASSISARSTSSSASIKQPQPITSTGATWVNSNRSNRAISSSSSSTSNGTTINLTNWTNPKPSLMSSSYTKVPTSNHYSPASASNPPRSYPIGASSASTADLYSSASPSKASLSSQPSQPGLSTPYRMPSISSSLLVAAPPSSAAATPADGYNPFASNILTTSIVDVLTKTKDSLTASGGNPDESSTTKMNFANVAKMNVPPQRSSHPDSIVVTMHESTSPPLQSDPKIAPGYRGHVNTTPVQQLMASTNFDSLSPTSQMSRAPGSNRTLASVSPSISKIHLDQNGHTGSSSASSTSSSPSSFKQPTPYFHPSQSAYSSVEPQKPFGAIGSHRASASNDENPLQIPAKFAASNPPGYHLPAPPAMLLSTNPSYANSSRNRSNLNPSAPEFQHGSPGSNGPLSSNIMNIARMMEQQQQQQQQQQQLQPPPYSSASASSPHPSQPSDLEAMQRVQSQVLHFYHLHTNQQQQQQQQHLVQPPPPPPQLSITLQIAKILAAKGQLPQDPNHAAAVVAACYYRNVLSRTPQTSNMPLSSNVNTNVYETINTQQTSSNSDDTLLPSGKTQPLLHCLR